MYLLIAYPLSINYQSIRVGYPSVTRTRSVACQNPESRIMSLAISPVKIQNSELWAWSSPLIWELVKVIFYPPPHDSWFWILDFDMQRWRQGRIWACFLLGSRIQNHGLPRVRISAATIGTGSANRISETLQFKAKFRGQEGFDFCFVFVARSALKFESSWSKLRRKQQNLQQQPQQNSER